MTILHSALPEASLHEPKGVSTAAANRVYISDGAGSGSWDVVPGSFNTEVIIRDASDFPTPISDVITLAADTVYFLDGDIDIGDDRIVLSSNSTIRGLGSKISSITTTTTGNVFTATSSFLLEGFSVTATTGTIFACTGGSTEFAEIYDLIINSCSSVGSFSSWSTLYWRNGIIITCTTGLSFAGTCSTAILELVNFVSGYTTAVDLSTATFNVMYFFRSGFQYASATNHINVAANGANINSGRIGRIDLCSFDAGATNIVNNLVSGDEEWSVSNNRNLQDSTKNAQGYLHTTTATTIGVGDGDSGNPKKVNCSTNFVNAHSDQFSMDTGGRITYTGLTPEEFYITYGIVGTTAAGTDTLAFYIAKNGTIITATKTEREFTSTAVGSPTPSQGIVSLENGDYIELYLENTTGTNNWSSELLNCVVGLA